MTNCWTALSVILLALFADNVAVAAAGPPQPRIVIINKAAILLDSKVGQDVSRQLKAYTEAARQALSARSQALAKEGQNLQQQHAILSPEAKQKRIGEFNAKQTALQTDEREKEDQLRTANAQAQAAISQAFGPILLQIVKERGANLVLDRQVVPISNGEGFDITADAINRLNAKISSYKINFAPSAHGRMP